MTAPVSQIGVARLGQKSMAVKRIQEALNQRMLPPHNQITKPPLKRLEPDGDFGPLTDAMVREFQRLNRITIDGIVGPETRLHLFPFVKVDGLLTGRGQFGAVPVGARSTSLIGVAGRPRALGEVVRDGDPSETKVVRFEPFVAAGTEFTLTKPWPPGSGSAQQAVTFGAVLIRTPKLELTGELEASKALKPARGEKWEWEGGVKLTYEAVPKFGVISPLSPFASIKLPSPLPVSLGIEAKLELLKDILDFTVDGEGAFGYDCRDDGGVVRAAAKVNLGLQFNLDIFLRKHPPSQP